MSVYECPSCGAITRPTDGHFCSHREAPAPTLGDEPEAWLIEWRRRDWGTGELDPWAPIGVELRLRDDEREDDERRIVPLYRRAERAEPDGALRERVVAILAEMRSDTVFAHVDGIGDEPEPEEVADRILSLFASAPQRAGEP